MSKVTVYCTMDDAPKNEVAFGAPVAIDIDGLLVRPGHIVRVDHSIRKDGFHIVVIEIATGEYEVCSVAELEGR